MRSGRLLRVAGGALLLSAALVAACSFFTDLDGLPGRDASTPDAPAEAAPAGGFAIALTPAHVTADPGDAPTTVVVTLTRGAGFTERVALSVKGGVTGASATTPPDVDVNATTSSFTVGVQVGAVVDYVERDFVVSGTSTTGITAPVAHLWLRIGSLLAAGDAGSIVIPDFAYAIDVKAWGAGGAGGGSVGNPATIGGAGGGGGFAAARFSVTPKSTLYAVAGTGGPLGCSQCGGPGGGFSGLHDEANAYWLIAGGGGGGGSSGTFTSGGGPGGGATGGTGQGGCGNGGAGNQSEGGVAGKCNISQPATGGTSLAGGDARNPTGKAGVPGGGRGGGNSGSAGGGGGGGYFGGGGGSTDNASSGSGGGGSGHVVDGGADATLTTGNVSTPPATGDPDYAAGAGTGGVGGDVANGVQPTAGANGRVVVRLAKP